MNSIQSNPFIHQQTARVNANSALRKAAASPELPNLTKDESAFIHKNFMASRAVESYSDDGKITPQTAERGARFDVRI